MHYTVPMPASNISKQEKSALSLKACADYLGKSRLRKLIAAYCREVRAKHYTSRQAYRMVRLTLEFAGVRGYWPARAVFEQVWVLA